MLGAGQGAQPTDLAVHHHQMAPAALPEQRSLDMRGLELAAVEQDPPVGTDRRLGDVQGARSTLAVAQNDGDAPRPAAVRTASSFGPSVVIKLAWYLPIISIWAATASSHRNIG